jgi:hypothetical protein
VKRLEAADCVTDHKIKPRRYLETGGGKMMKLVLGRGYLHKKFFVTTCTAKGCGYVIITTSSKTATFASV